MAELAVLKRYGSLRGWMGRWRSFMEYKHFEWLLKEQIRKERAELATMEDRDLLDIGVTREQALAEAARNFNDIPKHRLGSDKLGQGR